MDRLDFIREVFKFCKEKDEDNTFLRIYDRALSYSKPIDWQKMFDYFIDKAEKRTLPSPKFFKELLPACVKREIHECANDGNFIRIFYQSGKYADYVVSGFGLNLTQIKQKALNGDAVTEVRMYPKEVQIDGQTVQVSLIGENVYPTGTKYELIFARG